MTYKITKEGSYRVSGGSGGTVHLPQGFSVIKFPKPTHFALLTGKDHLEYGEWLKHKHFKNNFPSLELNPIMDIILAEMVNTAGDL